MRRGGERGRGVFWTITSEGWARYVASTTPPALVPEKPVVIDPEGWLAKSGLRLTRRSNG